MKLSAESILYPFRELSIAQHVHEGAVSLCLLLLVLLCYQSLLLRLLDLVIVQVCQILEGAGTGVLLVHGTWNWLAVREKGRH